MFKELRSSAVMGVLLAAVICASALEAAESVLQLETRDGLIYAAGEDVPFTGLNEDFHPNGKLWFRITIKAGVPDGKAEFWYENGNKKSELFFAEGVIVGLQRKWSEDGELVEEIDHGPE
jgi:antitoxin component YwqK of YwqJK toxin-antitoxin module